jgi:hypothetical protein
MSAPHPGAGRVADMLLRGDAAPVVARMVWPARSPVRPHLVVLFLDDASPAASALPNTLSTRLRALVMACSAATSFHEATRALEWAADHGLELGADSAHLVIAGAGNGCVLAARAAVHARDEGWPPVERQILIRPPRSFRVVGSMTGTAPVTVVGRLEPGVADAFRVQGIEVEELSSEEDL